MDISEIASSKGFESTGGIILIVGHSIHSAPRSESNLTRSLACFRALVTMIFLPKRGRFSNHFMVFRRETTPPIIIIEGDFSLAFFTFSTIVESVPVTETFHHLGHEGKVFIHSDRHNQIAAAANFDYMIRIPAGEADSTVRIPCT